MIRQYFTVIILPLSITQIKHLRGNTILLNEKTCQLVLISLMYGTDNSVSNTHYRKGACVVSECNDECAYTNHAFSRSALPLELTREATTLPVTNSLNSEDNKSYY